MSVSEIHHVALPVTSLERSVAFYQHVLGFRPTLRMNLGSEDVEKFLSVPPGARGRSVFLQGPSQLGQLELIEWCGGSTPGSRPGGMMDLGGFLISFEIEEGEAIEDRYRGVQETGAECLSEPLDVELENYGVIKTFVAKDPDGYLVEFVDLPSRAEILAYRSRHTPQAWNPTRGRPIPCPPPT